MIETTLVRFVAIDVSFRPERLREFHRIYNATVTHFI